MKRFQRILVSIDARHEEQAPLKWASLLAEHSGASLKLVDVVPAFSWPVRMAMRDHQHVSALMMQEKGERLEALAAPLRKRGLKVETKTLSGRTSDEIIREVLSGKHDLVARLAKGFSSRREGMLGTTTMRLLRKCPCAVWVVKADAKPHIGHILAAVDPTPYDTGHAELNDLILELGKSLAALEKARLSVLHAWSIYGESLLRSHMIDTEFQQLEKNSLAEVERAFEALLARHGMNIGDANVHLVRDDPVIAMERLTESGGVDLLVIGTTARSGVAGALMGNTCEKIVDQVPCSILALKPKGFVSPVTLEKS